MMRALGDGHGRARCPRRAAAPPKLLIVGLIAKHDIQADEELTCQSDFGLGPPPSMQDGEVTASRTRCAVTPSSSARRGRSAPWSSGRRRRIDATLGTCSTCSSTIASRPSGCPIRIRGTGARSSVTIGIETTGYTQWFHALMQRSVESLHGVAVVRELLLEDFARGRVKNGDLLLSRVKITSDECHESGLLAVGLVTVPQPEPTCSGGPFS
jgi:hypothetical protein